MNNNTRPYNDDTSVTRTQPQRPQFKTPPPMPPMGNRSNLPPMRGNTNNMRPPQPPKPPQNNKKNSLSPIAIIAIAVSALAIIIALFIFVIKPLVFDGNDSEGRRTTERINDTQISPESTSNPATSTNDRILAQIENDMVTINGGTISIGATYEQENPMDREYPIHEVTISSFKLSRYEVTQEQWQAVMTENPSHNIGANRPVDNVSWNDCQRFINRLNQLTGKNYRLPTEAEWEFAARGGNNSRNCQFSGSDYADGVAWHSGNSGNTSHDVGQKQPNELGLYDMSGNVFEWCSDFYGNYSYGHQYDPTGPSSSSSNQHVGRGGGYNLGAKFCRVSGRTPGKANYKSTSLGLRLAHD